jgi:hypothetical protein
MRRPFASFAAPVSSLAALALAVFAGRSLAQRATTAGALAPEPASTCPHASDSAGSHHSSMQDWSDGRSGRTRRWRVSWSEGDCSVDLRANGELAFTPDLSDVRSISPGGYLEIEERDGSHVRRYEAMPSDRGIERRWSVDGQTRPFDPDAARWLAAMLIELDRHTAFAAPMRVSHLLAVGGVDAVLDEIEHVTGDYARRVYYTTLLDSARLNEQDANRAMQQAGREIGSDYELASVLVALGKRGLVTAKTSEAYVGATATLESDYEHRRALTALFEVRELPPAIVEAMLRSALRIASAYERAELLVGVASRYALDDSLRSRYVQAANGISSDYERRRALSALLEHSTM